MSHRMIPQIVVLIGCLVVVSGCATGRMGGLFSAHQTQPDSAFTQQISLARLAERHGNHAGAKQLYRRVLTESPQHQLALHRMGVIAGREGEFDQAIEYLNKAAAVNGPSAEIYSDLGYVYYLQDNHELAQQTFEKALELNPDYAAAQTNLGIVYAELGDDERALKQFRRSLREAEALSSLAYIQSQRGDFDLAEQNYLKALDADKKLRPAAEALVQLAARTGSAAARPAPPEAAVARHTMPESNTQKIIVPAGQPPLAAPTQIDPNKVAHAVSTPRETVAPTSTGPDSLTDNPLRSTSRFAPTKVASIEMFRPSSLTQSGSTPQASGAPPTVTPVTYAPDGSAKPATSAATRPPTVNGANDGLVIPTPDLTMPAVYQISDQPQSEKVQQPPIAPSQIGSVQSASAKSFSQEIFKALQSASGP